MHEAPATIPPTVPSPDELVPAEFDLLCEQCGYSLIRLTTSTRCPECGAPIDTMTLPLARVPWLYRLKLGTWPSYWRTVWMTLVGPAAFAAELRRPARVSRADAKLFRRQSIRIALLAAAIGGLANWMILAGDVFFGLSTERQVFVGAEALIGLFCLYCFLCLATDLPTFIWRGSPSAPHHLAPVQLYASAGLALCPVVGVAIVATCAVVGPAMLTLYVAAGGIAAVTLVWYVTALRLMWGAVPRVGPVVMLACYLPVHVVIVWMTSVLAWLVGVYAISQFFEMGL